VVCLAHFALLGYGGALVIIMDLNPDVV